MLVNDDSKDINFLEKMCSYLYFFMIISEVIRNIYGMRHKKLSSYTYRFVPILRRPPSRSALRYLSTVKNCTLNLTELIWWRTTFAKNILHLLAPE